MQPVRLGGEMPLEALEADLAQLDGLLGPALATTGSGPARSPGRWSGSGAARAGAHCAPPGFPGLYAGTRPPGRGPAGEIAGMEHGQHPVDAGEVYGIVDFIQPFFLDDLIARFLHFIAADITAEQVAHQVPPRHVPEVGRNLSRRDSIVVGLPGSAIGVLVETKVVVHAERDRLPLDRPFLVVRAAQGPDQLGQHHLHLDGIGESLPFELIGARCIISSRTEETGGSGGQVEVDPLDLRSPPRGEECIGSAGSGCEQQGDPEIAAAPPHEFREEAAHQSPGVVETVTGEDQRSLAMEAVPLGNQIDEAVDDPVSAVYGEVPGPLITRARFGQALVTDLHLLSKDGKDDGELVRMLLDQRRPGIPELGDHLPEEIIQA